MKRRPMGKPTLEELRRFILRYKGADTGDILLGPGVAVDSGVVKIKETAVALKADPITGAVSEIGKLAVIVPSNDVAAVGAEPRWFVAVILLPTSYGIEDAEKIMKDIDEEARRLGLSIVGGHTEFTEGLTHPVVCGFVAGIPRRILDASRVEPGCKIVLTKTLGLEATAVIASDFAEEVIREFGAEFQSRCLAMRRNLSIIPEAMAAAEVEEVVAMHDLTEGGFAAAVVELAEASGLGFKVYEDRIPVANETVKLCRYFGLDPLRILSSGSLMIAVKPEGVRKLRRKLKEAGVEFSVVGEFLGDSDKRVLITRDGKLLRLEAPYRDELWKLLEKTTR